MPIGHRKSGNFTAGVGRQYIGEIGKTDNGNVVVTTHLREAKGWLGLKEYQVREKKSLERHFVPLSLIVL
jgi:SRSO17 transposase